MVHLQDVPLATRGRLWIQHDRAAPRVGTEFAVYVNENNQGRSIGRSGLVARTPRSSQLILFSYFLLGCMGSMPESRNSWHST